MKRIIIIIVAAICSQYASAQAQHEYSIYAGGGFSPFHYKLKSGDGSGGIGGDFGAGYTYFFRPIEVIMKSGMIYRSQWAVYSGVGVGYYRAKAKIDNYKAISANLDDGTGEYSKFEMHTKFSGYNETQSTLFLNIPVMAQFHMEQYYAGAGFKVGIPLVGKYKSKDATLTNEAYYHELDNWLKDGDWRGLGEFKGMNSKGDLDLGFTVMFALEAGMKWRIYSNLSAYTGIYFDYGLNNSLKSSNKSFVNYNAQNADKFTTNSVLNPFTEKARIMAVGVKVRFALRP